MALTVILDTSVLIRLSEPSVRAAVEEVLETERVARTTITDLEIGFSARSGAEHDALLGFTAEIDELVVGAPEQRRALSVQRTLAERGLRGRKIPDLLIAAAAEISGAQLLHYDQDFDHIATVTGQSCRWVVPRGSLD
ncbi:MAG: PIN domain-containing protein [Actinomycetes bacterium]